LQGNHGEINPTDWQADISADAPTIRINPSEFDQLPPIAISFVECLNFVTS
jgi:hypothetical protein